MKLIFVVLCAVVCLFLNACNSQTDQTPVAAKRLENELFAAKSPDDLAKLLVKYPFLRAYLGLPTDAPDSLVTNQLYNNVSNAQLQKFKQEIQTEFSDLADIESQLGKAFGEIKAQYPAFKTPQVYTAITGFLGSDLYVTDSLIVVGLDYFGGPKATYRPQLYDYQLRRYQKEYVVAAILFFMAKTHNKFDPADQTLLSEMIWYGKGYEFVKHAAPQIPDSLIIGYSEQQLADVYESQQDVWAYFLDRKLLFQTKEEEKQRFLAERPATVEISGFCPGGVGRWLGWRIVGRYLAENPNVQLNELMKNPNARQIFEGAKYKGQKDEK
ncbi:MAG: gliding motility protein [Runella slithyformis]|nr:MAG: gliding motility protein [Runella slithyformis]TAF29003.1 MAG: gliding motility protein [Runella slithyformis]TAF46462.1 MAG: gliding motility protein [Runella slithyformis]TAF82593.1 MAG: gliding motility protein [Runella slithyformis]